MAYEQRPNTGTVFFKRDDEAANKPDYRLEFNVDGKAWRVAGWWKDGKGGRFLSLKIEPPGDDKSPLPF